MKKKEPSKINTLVRYRPMVYAYTTLNMPDNEGLIKIGYTEGDVDKRIRKQGSEINAQTQKEWERPAYYSDEKTSFKDHDFHAYLRKIGIERYDAQTIRVKKARELNGFARVPKNH